MSSMYSFFTGHRNPGRQPMDDNVDGGGMSTLLADADAHGIALLIGAGVPYEEGRDAYLTDHGFGGGKPDPDGRENLDGFDDVADRSLELVS